jgi:hypothetical protein
VENGRARAALPLRLAGADRLARCSRRVAGHHERLAEGNPLFIEQVTAFPLEAGGSATLTDSIRAVLQARLDRLDADERNVLERAAVLGRSFSFEDALDLIPPGGRDRAQGRLFDLVRRGLLRPDTAGEEGFRFSHALVRDAVYDAMPKALRADLHEAVAEQVARAGRSEAVTGFHLERAFQLRGDLGAHDPELGTRAGLVLSRAAQEAFGRGDVPGAIALFERARAVLPSTDPSLPLLLTSLGAARINAGDTAAATSTLDAASTQRSRSATAPPSCTHESSASSPGCLPRRRRRSRRAPLWQQRRSRSSKRSATNSPSHAHGG